LVSAVLWLSLPLCVLFIRSFKPHEILFSNDGPLGANMARFGALPEAFLGTWRDLNWVGGPGTALVNLTSLLLWLLKPVAFAKFYVPCCLLILGFSACLFFRQLGFRPAVGVLGGLAAMFNADFFSYACWGLGSHTLAVAGVFLALAALVMPAAPRAWVRASLAGTAVGLAVIEGFDSGAILSLYVAAFVMAQAWVEPGSAGSRLTKGLCRLMLVAGFAAFLAAQALTVLIGTSIQGILGMEESTESKVQRWDFATQWSLPKSEALRVIIPGLYGYRMDTPDGGNYWGAVGQTPGVRTSRWSGSGIYGGVLVVLVAVWAGLQSFRGGNSVFSVTERRRIWFWVVALVASLLLAFGRHAPFYQFFYALPYFSTIRNPIKFMHPFGIALVILFGFGLQGLWRRHVERALGMESPFAVQFKAWWTSVSGFDRGWTRGLLVALAMAVFGWVLYVAWRTPLEQHLHQVGFPDELGSAIAGVSIAEVGWFVLFLGVSIALMTLVMGGALSGYRARWAGLALGGLLFIDFARANRPWIVYWNHVEKYATNPVIDLLRRRPYEQRVKLEPPIFLQDQLPGLHQVYGADKTQLLVQYYGLLKNLYDIEWVQHLFLYYNIHCLDVIQEPRMAVENAAFKAAFPPTNSMAQLRLLQLTNTRFILGIAGESVSLLNQRLDPDQHRFRVQATFTLVPKGTNATRATDLTAVLAPNGPLALIEFTGALPRASLFANWQVITNDQATLQRLAEPAFDPWQTVLVADKLTGATPAPATNHAAGTVEFISYAPKRIELEADAKSAVVLLLNDKFDPNWKAQVDGRPVRLLRCNYLMRGVQLAPGKHRVEFRYDPPCASLYITLAAIGVATALCTWVILSGGASRESSSTGPRASPDPRAAVNNRRST
jgi:hypothetical protein